MFHACDENIFFLDVKILLSTLELNFSVLHEGHKVTKKSRIIKDAARM